jgi:hypothetical protein
VTGDDDVFLFNSALDATTNVGTITDMKGSGDDIIHLKKIIFTALTATGVLAAGAFRTDAAALDADDRVIANDVTGELSTTPMATLLVAQSGSPRSAPAWRSPLQTLSWCRCAARSYGSAAPVALARPAGGLMAGGEVLLVHYRYHALSRSQCGGSLQKATGSSASGVQVVPDSPAPSAATG